MKSEQDKDSEDYIDSDRKPDGLQQYQRNFQTPYFQHPMSMLNGVAGNYGNIQSNRLKAEVEMHQKSQQQVVECGVPIPASKPKIWSLADTAACKTPPHLQPNAWIYPPDPSMAEHNHQQQQNQLHHQQHNAQMQQQQQHNPQMQEHHMMENGPNIGMNANMIHPDNYGAMCAMTGMMSSFGTDSPYTRYGGFLGHTSSGLSPHQQIYLNHNSSQSGGGSVTPLTPNSACLSTTPTLNQQQQHAIQSNQSMGFPEIQTGIVTHLLNNIF